MKTGDTLRLDGRPRPARIQGKHSHHVRLQRPVSRAAASRGAGCGGGGGFSNALDQPTTVHWHGVRLDNRFDGVPGLTQKPVPPGGRFTYRLRFPDAGIYWYHPHVREDMQQDLGLFGNIVVRSPRADYFTPAHREEVLMLDDLLVGDDGLVPFGEEATTHALMGRFGNVFLVNGEPRYALAVRRGEVVRFLLTNVSNTRTFNLSFPGARMKLVGSDVGNYEREEWVESVVIAPAERYIVEVRFEVPGRVALVNRVQALDHLYGRFFYETDTLGIVRVADAAAAPDLASSFGALRADRHVSDDIRRYRAHFARPVDRDARADARDTRSSLRDAAADDARLGVLHARRVERDDAAHELGVDRQAGAVGRARPRDREREHGCGLEIPARRRDQASAGQRAPVLSRHAAPDPHSRPALPRAGGERCAEREPRLEGHGARSRRLGDRRAARAVEPGRWMLHCHIAEHLSADMMMAFTVN